MNSKSNWLVHDHHMYEETLENCLEAAEVNDWKDAVALFKKFLDDIQLHMRIEDDVIYPLIADKHGDIGDKVARLNDEHDDIVRLANDMVHVIMTKDFDHFERSLEPLYKVLSRHNRHEEAVFLSAEVETILLQRDEIMMQLEAISPQSQGRNWDF